MDGWMEYGHVLFTQLY